MKHRMFVWKVWPLAGIAILLALSGCGDDGGGPEILPVEEQLAAGWARFGEGNYSGAIEKFDEAVRTDPALGDGHNGLGWSYLRLDSLDVALGEFQLAVAKGFVGADAEAGRCLILNRLDEYRQAIFAGEAVLATDAAFKLEGDVTIDVRDVRLAMAQSYYALGEYVEALEQITTVDAAILINPNSATFAAELLAAIEELTGDLTSS